MTQSHQSSYLTIIPTGLELSMIQLLRTSICSSPSSHDVKILYPPYDSLTAVGDESESLLTLSKLDVAVEKVREMIRTNREKKMKRREENKNSRSMNVDTKCGGMCSSRCESANAEIQKKDIDEKIMVDVKDHVTGTMKCHDGRSEISLGYHRLDKSDHNKKNCIDDDDDVVHHILSCPGNLEGVSFVHFRTNAPASVVASIRGMGCGPLLALVDASWITSEEIIKGENDDDSNNKIPLPTNRNIISQIEQHIQQRKEKMSYQERLEKALDLWYQHAHETWFGSPNSSSSSYYGLHHFDKSVDLKKMNDDLHHAMKESGVLKYRLSLVRCYSKRKKKKKKKRQKRKRLKDHEGEDDDEDGDKKGDNNDESHANNDMSREQMTHELVKILIPSTNKEDEKEDDTHHPKNNEKRMKFRVDLTKYDFEIVAFLHPHTGPSSKFTIAIPLRPYQHFHSKSYASGTIPPDITPPYYNLLANNNNPVSTKQNNQVMVRLRPSTAVHLLHCADIQQGDIILDPCGGMGTIPVEASLFQNGDNVAFGLGGDIALSSSASSPPFFLSMTSEYLSLVQRFKSEQTCRTTAIPPNSKYNTNYNNNGGGEMLAWNATLLPLRDGCIDKIISDLPFGQRCLSTHELMSFLPPFIHECGRVLRRNKKTRAARMVFLCGSSTWRIMEDIMKEQNRQRLSVKDDVSVFCLPPRSLFPVNIGGLTAWIVVVDRGCGDVIPLMNHRDRVRKMVSFSRRWQ